MKSFRDARDRTWELTLNCDTVEAIQADCGCNVLDLLDPDSDVSQQVAAFPPVIAKLLYAALADQAQTKSVDPREFRRSMNGEALNQATEALMAEILDFSPRYRRKLAAAVLEKNREVQDAAVDLALTRLADPTLKAQILAGMDSHLREQMEAALERIGGQRSEVRGQDSETASLTAAGTPPDSSASPGPDRSPGGNSAG